VEQHKEHNLQHSNRQREEHNQQQLLQEDNQQRNQWEEVEQGNLRRLCNRNF
jgi:hypothetical protein